MLPHTLEFQCKSSQALYNEYETELKRNQNPNIEQIADFVLEYIKTILKKFENETLGLYDLHQFEKFKLIRNDALFKFKEKIDKKNFNNHEQYQLHQLLKEKMEECDSELMLTATLISGELPETKKLELNSETRQPSKTNNSKIQINAFKLAENDKTNYVVSETQPFFSNIYKYDNENQLPHFQQCKEHSQNNIPSKISTPKPIC